MNRKLAVPIFFLCCLPLSASLVSVDIGKSVDYSQNSAGGPLSLTGYFFAARAFYGVSGDFNSGNLAFPGGTSPENFSNIPGPTVNPISAGYLIDQSGFFNTQSDLNAAYPFGTYTFNAVDSTNTNPPQSAALDYTADVYPLNDPFVSNYNSLQGFNPTQNFSLGFNAQDVNPGADESFDFVTIYTAGFASTVFSDQFLSSSTTSDLIPANTLAPNTTYIAEIIFDNRLDGTDSISGVPADQLFDTRTDVTFTTGSAVPEPAGLAWIGFGVLCILLVIRDRERPSRSSQK